MSLMPAPLFSIPLLAAVVLALAGCAARPAVEADLVLRGGHVWTVDPARSEAEGVAVWQGRILSVGSDAEVSALIGPKTRVVELDGRLLLPGFVDDHTHFLTGGFSLSEVKLKDAADPEEFGRRLAAHSAGLPPGAWITGGTWDQDRWPGRELPTAALIDRYVPDRPVFVSRYDGHMSVANSLALRLAGVTARSPDPEGGVIVRRAGSREPAGVLKDTAQELVYRVMPEAGEAEVRAALEAALAEARRVGVTSLSDMSLDARELRIFQDLLAAGRLTARINGLWPLARWRELERLGLRQDFSDRDLIKVGCLKGFVDGSLGSSTALFFEPYTHDPSTRGIFITPPEELRQQILAADAAGLQVAVHAIGDRAVAWLLDAYTEAEQRNGPRDRRFRIEHAQHVRPEDFPRFAELGVIPSAQPYHAVDDGRWAIERVGEERGRTTYAFRTFLEAGARLCFGTDWTVAPLDPLLGIDAAVHRRTLDGAHPDGWYPEQKLSVEEAIGAYTLASAYASFDEGVKGSVTPGKWADLVVLSRDIVRHPEEIAGTEVVLTVVGGQVVFEK